MATKKRKKTSGGSRKRATSRKRPASRKKNPARKRARSVNLKNFTGRVELTADKTVRILGRGRRGR